MGRWVLTVVVVLGLGACDDGSTVDAGTRQPEGSPREAPGILTISNDQVRRGETVTISFEPPKRYAWGVTAELNALRQGTRRAVATLYHERGPKELETIWPGTRTGYNSIGFSGPADWSWTVPRLLLPGDYEIRKRATRPGPRPVEERTIVAITRFVVVP
jgi:hypothetical protein